MQTIKPAKGYLFCKPDDAIKKTSSGILLSDKAAEKPKMAEIINVGEEVTQFRPHDRIVYRSYAATEFKLNGNDYFLLPSEDVLGLVLEISNGDDIQS